MKNLTAILILVLISALTSACAEQRLSQVGDETPVNPVPTVQSLTPAATETPPALPPAAPSATSTSLSTATPPNTVTSIPTNTPSPSPLPPTDTPQPVVTNSPTATSTATPSPVPPQPTESPSPVPQITPTQPGQTTRTVRVGVHGRNDRFFHELDYQLIREANIETIKMMSLTDPTVFARIKQENPDIEFIVRLYDDRINTEGHPTPQDYTARMIPLLEQLRPFVTKFEIGNEPNHVYRYEGWGSEDADAENFNIWFLEVYDLLKSAHPWAELGYPALATPDSFHRDRAWLEITRPAIDRADWLGVHCYWQSPPDQTSTMFAADRGLCFKYYHALFPNKPLEITEFDNDNIIWDVPPNTPAEIAEQYVSYYQELFKYPYIRSASSFIMSSPDSRWDYFAWRTEADGFKPVVAKIAQMSRPSLVK